MDGTRRQKPRPAERLPNDATATHSIRDGDMGSEAGATSLLSSQLASELFARLLLELPGHRRELQAACRDGDRQRLARATHKLLGAVVYCNLPELADALRVLKQITESGDATQTGPALDQALRLIDELLACSGYREP